MKAKAIAYINIALIKYWGKENRDLITPTFPSLSVTLKSVDAHTPMQTETEVEFVDGLTSDQILMNGKTPSQDKTQRILQTLNLIREKTFEKRYARVETKNTFPTGAGLASSASGAAALVCAALAASGQNPGKDISWQDVSRLARRNSGSGSRSVFGGLVQWNTGDDQASFARQIFDENFWPELRCVAVITEEKEKEISSRNGMQQSIETCPFYGSWKKVVPDQVESLKKYYEKKDFENIGKMAEHSCLLMHSVMMTTVPPIIYWNPLTVEIIHNVIKWRENGLPCFFTVDGGPQVKIFTLAEYTEKVLNQIVRINGVKKTYTLKVAPGPQISYGT